MNGDPSSAWKAGLFFDVSKIPEASWPLLEGLDTLILDALRYKPHPTHFNLAEALEVVERLKPRRVFPDSL